MRLYLAWVNGEWHFMKLIEDLGHKNFLCSYHYLNRKTALDFLKKYKAKGMNIFLDSGAFSSDDIDIKMYSEFLEEWHKHVAVCANMDVWDWNNQMNNLKIIESKGVNNVLPVYHIYEWMEWKFKELDDLFEKYEYFAIGWIAVATASSSQKDLFLKYVFSRWNYYRKKQGYPTKIHWFWVTSTRLCLKYPFYSVDSTSWLAASRFWDIIVFNKKKGDLEKVHSRSFSLIADLWHKIPVAYRDIDRISDTKNKVWKPYIARNFLAGLAYIQFYEYATEVWKKRGLVYKD